MDSAAHSLFRENLSFEEPMEYAPLVGFGLFWHDEEYT
jgi:hypothetical protein